MFVSSCLRGLRWCTVDSAEVASLRTSQQKHSCCGPIRFQQNKWILLNILLQGKGRFSLKRYFFLPGQSNYTSVMWGAVAKDGNMIIVATVANTVVNS